MSAKKKKVAKKPVAKKPVAKRSAAKKPAAKKVAKAKPKAAKAKPATKAKAKPAAKAKAKPVAKAKPKAVKAKPAAMKRRDGAGHLDPKYASDLRARLRQRPKSDERAFAADALSEELGEEFVETVTSGEDEGTEIRDGRVTEELGGPFTVTSGGTEFAGGVDGSNPKRATREPFPRS